MSATTTLLSVVPSFLRAVASAPAASSFLTPVVDSILLTAAALIDRGEEGAAELLSLTDHIKIMVASGTDPTADDWALLQARSDAAHATISGSVSRVGDKDIATA